MGNFCRTGNCIPPQPLGALCAQNAHCDNGFCADVGHAGPDEGGSLGVCCESACNGPCETCLAKFKATGNDGACAAVAAGLDPDEECAAESPSDCGHNGECDGAGKCAKYGPSTVCSGTSSCTVSGSSATVTGLLCDGQGTCQSSGSSSKCDPFSKCNGTTCANSCGSSSDCIPNFFCLAGQCLRKKKLGAGCGQGDECITGYCADGKCCAEECRGVCQFCTAKGSCETISGLPRGSRGSCPGGTSENPCLARICNGKNPDVCDGFVGQEVTCHPAACSGGVATPETHCNGAGACNEILEIPCNNLVCEGVVCKDKCASDDDCVSGAVCDESSGKCNAGNACVDTLTLIDLKGNLEPCPPYVCEAGECLKACDRNEDCAPGYLCNADSGECLEALGSRTTVADPSCGCRVAGSPTARGSWLTLLGLLALWRRRR